ncbi:Acyl dehydratase [Halogranum amylolyticum]|uniref:Acyl dehydratase n=1 Tax=Halogranum amylolyticum TaxID=660520 RepID=A0A1H8UZA8_9EURY|nr:MaoC/PaaZ C-terminal domain-containing protein [Halogranum amylolyticum]SEP08481.1 Acyl dehydratase [Halogranum amylolyticum]
MVVPILVREVMHAPAETLATNTPITGVAERLKAIDDNAVVVLRDSEPVGIITRTDLVDVLAAGENLEGQTAESVMSQPSVTVSESAPIRVAAATLYEHDVDQAPVMEGETVIGLLRTSDLAPYLPDCAMSRPEEPLEAEERDWESEYDDEAAPGVSVGDVVRFSKPITERDLKLFAEISGDKNRLHLDEAFAERTRFKRRIVHGALASSVISAALSKLPGLVIYLSQNVTYNAPVEIGERVTARCEVVADLGHNRYRLAIEELDENDTEVISGEAAVLIDPLPKPETTS